MQQTIFHPTKALAPFISHYVFLTSDESDYKGVLVKDFPRTAMDILLVFNGSLQIIRDQDQPLQLSNYDFIGMFDKAYKVQIPKNFFGLHIRFKANGIYPLTKLPLSLAFNKHISLLDFIGTSIKDLYDELGHVNNYPEIIKKLESWLLPFYQPEQLHYRLNHGLELVENSKGLIKVKALSEALNTNYKTIDRWFQKKIGVTPKTYLQITRFKNVIASIENSESTDWLQITHDYEFHDQAHFIKSFKQFAGITPASYLKENIGF